MDYTKKIIFASTEPQARKVMEAIRKSMGAAKPTPAPKKKKKKTNNV